MQLLFSISGFNSLGFFIPLSTLPPRYISFHLMPQANIISVVLLCNIQFVMMYYACKCNCRGGVKQNDILKRYVPLAMSLTKSCRKKSGTNWCPDETISLPRCQMKQRVCPNQTISFIDKMTQWDSDIEKTTATRIAISVVLPTILAVYILLIIKKMCLSAPNLAVTIISKKYANLYEILYNELALCHLFSQKAQNKICNNNK